MDVSQLSHIALKDHGNKYYSACHFNKALECYTKAIDKQPNVSVYYTNRALCFLRLREWQKAIADCRLALEHDSLNIKAFYFMGLAYLELEFYDDALPRLFRAHEIALEQRRNCGDDITAAIRAAKRKKFEVTDAKRRQEEVELQAYVEGLIKADRERRLSQMDESCDDAAGAEAYSSKKSELLGETKSNLVQISDLFSQVDERRKKREIPDYLCGRISFELMRDPVITPSGITYDRKSIVEHLHRVGHFDPITRQPLTEDKLIPNIAMKEVISTYLEDNPWAEDY